MAKEKRFEEVYSQGSMSSFRIILDNETGVQYLYAAAGYGIALTPLLDENGKVVVVPVDGNISF